mgnify:CR=1 FL=1
MCRKCYVTTPIYYASGTPQLGNSYSTVACDVFARFNRLMNRDTFYLTGMDEHGQKIAQAAKNAGMKYVVLTTQHHDGFSLWDSKVNPYNSVNYGPKRDIVRDYVEACRKHGLKVGLYYSLNNWIHPDGQLSVFEEV